MAPKFLSSSTTLLLALNLLVFSLATSTNNSPAPPKAPVLTAVQKSKPITLTPPHPAPTISPVVPKFPTTPPPSCPTTPPPSCPTTPTTKSPAKPPTKRTCPRDALKLGVCANVLGGLIGLVVGTPDKQPCCALLEGLADLEATVCLCTAIKANVLGINLNVPIDLSLLLNYCGKKAPTDFKCA